MSLLGLNELPVREWLEKAQENVNEGLSAVLTFVHEHGDEKLGISIALGVVSAIIYRNRAFLLGCQTLPSISVNAPKEADPQWKGSKRMEQAQIRDSRHPGAIQCYDKCSLELLGAGSVPVMTPENVREAVQRARVAQQKWAQTSFEERRQFLRLLQEYVTRHQDEICRVSVRDTGKTMVDAAFGEVLTTCEKIAWTIAEGEKALKPEYRSTGAIMMHKVARVEYVPLGVMGAIIPWNYPFHNMFGQIISTLFAGNAIVLKVSEYSSWSSQYYADIARAALMALGHSPDLIQIVTGFGETGAALVNSGVDKIVFIGSPTVGKLVMRAAAETLTPVVLELGGKDAAVVCDDCDFNQVVNLALRGTFQNCGQNCIGLERLIVNQKVYDKLVNALTEKVRALKQGSPLTGDVDCGAMTMGDRQVKEMKALIDDAVTNGARLLAGGKQNNVKGCSGTFFEPTLLVDVTPTMKIAQTEVFGPCMVVMKARDDEDAIRIANSAEYGLGSSVFSKNYKRAEHIASRLMTGMCNINDFGVNYLCQSLPFGGVKISGFDRFAGIEGLRGCCLMRSVTTDKFPGVRTDIPGPLQYPVTASGFEFCRALINMFYGTTLWARVRAMGALARIGATGK